jgi:AcrR family transcriptional regulator
MITKPDKKTQRTASEITTGPRIPRPRAAATARERILAAAYDLFARRGIRAVGIDAVITYAGVAKMTFYHHFPSKEDLVLAFLDRREEVWTRGWLQTQILNRASKPKDRLLAIFDVLGEWFERKDFENCSFIRTLLEVPDAGHPLNTAARVRLANIRGLVADLALDAAIADPEEFARKWVLLMRGAIISAGAGDHDAAGRAKDLALLALRAASPGRGPGRPGNGGAPPR